MTKEQREFIDNLYSSPDDDNANQDIDMNRRMSEREKRIRQRNAEQQEKFDLDNEIIIGMTNKNNQKAHNRNQRKLTKKQERILKNKKKKKRILRIFILLFLIIGVIVFALTSPMFNIKEIVVLNNDMVSSDTIISLSQIKVGQNLFKYNRNESEKQIKTEPYIESVTISRNLPNKVEIDVKERQRSFNVEFLNEYFYINNQGYILEISEEKLDLPVIKGISTEEDKIVPGNRLDKEDLEKLEIVIQMMNICKNYEIDTKVSSIDITNKNNYVIYMEEEEKTIYLGDGSNLSNKMLYVPVLLSENEGKSGEIYLDGDLNNNFKPRFKLSVEI